MKRKLAALLFVSTVALISARAYAGTTQVTAQGLTREQVKAQLYQAYLNGTTAEDEKNSYPSPPSDRPILAALRKKEARVNPAP